MGELRIAASNIPGCCSKYRAPIAPPMECANNDACEIPDARLNNLNHELMEIARVIVIAIHMDDIILVYLSARIAVTTVLHEENLVASEPIIFRHLVKFPPEAAVTVEHDDAALRRIILRCMVVLNRNAVIWR